jgi:hypothetical protein
MDMPKLLTNAVLQTALSYKKHLQFVTTKPL